MSSFYVTTGVQIVGTRAGIVLVESGRKQSGEILISRSSGVVAFIPVAGSQSTHDGVCSTCTSEQECGTNISVANPCLQQARDTLLMQKGGMERCSALKGTKTAVPFKNAGVGTVFGGDVTVAVCLA